MELAKKTHRTMMMSLALCVAIACSFCVTVTHVKIHLDEMTNSMI